MSTKGTISYYPTPRKQGGIAPRLEAANEAPTRSTEVTRKDFNVLSTRILISLVALWVSLATVACPSHEERIRSLGPDVSADLVIFFNHDVTPQQIENFWRDTLSKPHAEGRGHDHRDGVSQIARIVAVQGHEGISVSFFASATETQREAVERDVRSSPLVYKVLKDIAPVDVKKIE